MSDAQHDFRLRPDLRLDLEQNFADFHQCQIIPTGEVGDDAGGVVERDALQQRVMHGLLDGLVGLIATLSLPDGHQRAAAQLHQAADVGEVDVDQPRFSDQFGDALDSLAQYIIRQAEGDFHRQVAWGDVQQAVVGDGDQGVSVRAQVCQSQGSVALPAAHLE